MVIARGDVVWVDFGPPRGPQPAKTRPAIVLQDDWLLATDVRTVLTVPLTTNTALEAFPGNVLVPAESAGLPNDSVAVVSGASVATAVSAPFSAASTVTPSGSGSASPATGGGASGVGIGADRSARSPRSRRPLRLRWVTWRTL